MRVALINLPTRYDLKVINIGMYYIARAVRDAGHELSVFDCVSENLSIQDVIFSLKRNRPDVIALSGMVTTYYFLEPLCAEVKKAFPDIPILAGGSVGSSIVNIIEKHTGIDYVIEGEGEDAVVEFLKALESGKADYSNIAGLYFRRDGKFRYTRSRNYEGTSIGALDKIPYPSYEDINMEFYISNITKIFGSILPNFPEYRDRKFRLFPLVPTRGCPYSCSFCYRLIKKHRTHSVDYLINQIKFLAERYNINGFPLFDELIMASPEWLMSFCDRVAEEKLDVIFFSGGGKPNLVKKDLLAMMKRANFVKLGYGVESGSQKILDMMSKKTTVEQNYRAVMDTYDAGIFSQSNFVFGHPGENKDTIRETARFIARTNRTKENYQIFFLAVYPGTEVYDHALSKGLIKDERDHLLKVTGQSDYLVNLSEFKTRNDLIFNVWKYINLYDGVTLFKKGRVFAAFNRWMRMLLSVFTFYISGKKWPRGEDFIKRLISGMTSYKFKDQDFLTGEIDPLKVN